MRRVVMSFAVVAASIGLQTMDAGAGNQATTPAGRATWTHLLHSVHSLVKAQSQSLLGLPLGIDVPLQYNGGPVQVDGSTSYAIFWEPPGSTVSAPYHGLVQRYLTDFGGSSLDTVETQYYQGNLQHIAAVSRLGGAVVDTRPYPQAVLQDNDIQNEVLHAMATQHWSAGMGSVFYVFTPKGVTSCLAGQCSFSVFCAYHGSFVNAGVQALYADMPYAGTDLAGCGVPSSPNGDPASDAEISILSHEQAETITDPLGTAWTDAFGMEIGDKCRSSYGTGSPNLIANGHPYEVQQEYSNRAGLLVGACSGS